MTMADTLLIISSHRPVLSILCKKCPATDKLKNQHAEIKIHAEVNISFSSPLNCNELVPITPIVSNSACGLSKETEAAKSICFFADSGFFPGCNLAGLLYQVTKPIKARKQNPVRYIIVFNHGMANTTRETPKTAQIIKMESQSTAVKTLGIACKKWRWFAP